MAFAKGMKKDVSNKLVQEFATPTIYLVIGLVDKHLRYSSDGKQIFYHVAPEWQLNNVR